MCYANGSGARVVDRSFGQPTQLIVDATGIATNANRINAERISKLMSLGVMLPSLSSK